MGIFANPEINIIFTTGYSEYTGEAFALHASGYIMKPITQEKIEREIADLRHPIDRNQQERVQVHAFGAFDVLMDGKPVEFQYEKTKELFAYLVDRQGAFCTNNEMISLLGEEKAQDSQLKKVRSDLFDKLSYDIFDRQWGKLAVKPDTIQCDYYQWLAGDPLAINSYHGEYMSQYSWAHLSLKEKEDENCFWKKVRFSCY